MSYRVIVLPEAERDADRIYGWIAERSPPGAQRWYEEFLSLLRDLSLQAGVYGLAPENEHLDAEIRQTFFQTRRGHRYRVLFTIRGRDVWVLHVRGPSQDLVGPQDLRTPGP